MRKIWTPKSYRNWARIHHVSEAPSEVQIPSNIQLVHDITKYGYTEESSISYQASIALTSPTTQGFFNANVGWNANAHNFVYHMGFEISNGADADADARICFAVLVPNKVAGTTFIPLSEQFIIPKVTSEQSFVGHTLTQPFLMQPSWYPGIFWNGALATSTGTLYVVHIESEE